MMHKQEQAKEEYMREHAVLMNCIDDLRKYADDLFSIRLPEEVTWANVAELKYVTSKLHEVIDFIKQNDD